MTPEEAIKIIEYYYPKRKRFTCGIRIDVNDTECTFGRALTVAMQALEEIQEYREIGTVEECRKARENQKPKAPIMKPYFADMPDEKYLCCPACGDILTDRIPNDPKNFYFHCLNCGQKFDWGAEDERD